MEFNSELPNIRKITESGRKEKEKSGYEVIVENNNVFNIENSELYTWHPVWKIKDKIIVANRECDEIRIYNGSEKDDDMLLYFWQKGLEAYHWQDAEHGALIKEFEDNLYKNSHTINSADFKFIKDFNENDKRLLNKVFNYKVFLNDFKLSFQSKDLSLDEIVSFLRYCEKLKLNDFNENFLKPTLDQKNNMHDVTNMASYFRAFLSIEHGGQDMALRIMYLAEILPQETAKKIFEKYTEIVNETENVASYVEENTNTKDTENLKQIITETLLRKGKDLLAEYGDKVAVCKDEDCSSVAKELEEKLKLFKVSTLTFGATVKELVKRGEFNLEDFKAISLEETSSDNISDTDKTSMSAIAFENNRQYPDELAQYWYGTAKEAIEGKNSNEKFIIVRHQKDIASFMRVQENADGTYYGASFNVNPFVKGSRIGTELLKKVIEEYSQKGDFYADVWADNPMLQNYIKDFGFEIIGEEENYKNTGTKVIKIVKKKQENKNT